MTMTILWMKQVHLNVNKVSMEKVLKKMEVAPEVEHHQARLKKEPQKVKINQNLLRIKK